MDVGDHPPITPMRNASEEELGGGDAWRLYEYIARHFLGSLSTSCSYLRTKVEFLLGNNEQLSWAGNQVKQPGWTSVMHWKAMSDEVLPAEILKDQTFTVSSIAAKEGQTSPPDYLTESDLLSSMEKFGIGTDASMGKLLINIRLCFEI